MSTDPRDVATIVEERDSLKAERDALAAQAIIAGDALAAQDMKVASERNALLKERDALRRDLEQTTALVAHLRDHRDTTIRLGAEERDHLRGQRDALEAERDAAAPVIDAAESMTRAPTGGSTMR